MQKPLFLATATFSYLANLELSLVHFWSDTREAGWPYFDWGWGHAQRAARASGTAAGVETRSFNRPPEAASVPAATVGAKAHAVFCFFKDVQFGGHARLAQGQIERHAVFRRHHRIGAAAK